jgi:hypothetical protein
MTKYRIKDEFYHYWSNGQPYNQEYAVVDEEELERLAGVWARPVEELKKQVTKIGD